MTRSLPHLIMSLSVIAAVSVLAAVGVITGQEALPVIAAAGGFTLGGTSVQLSQSTGTVSTAGESAGTSATTPPPQTTQITTTSGEPY